MSFSQSDETLISLSLFNCEGITLRQEGDPDTWQWLSQQVNFEALAQKTKFIPSNWLQLYYDPVKIKTVYLYLTVKSDWFKVKTVEAITGLAVGVEYTESYSQQLKGRSCWLDWLWSDYLSGVKGRGTYLCQLIETSLSNHSDNIYLITLESAYNFYLKRKYQPIVFDTTLINNPDILFFAQPCRWHLMIFSSNTSTISNSFSSSSCQNKETLGLDWHVHI